jgi:hypothetical protein
VIPKNQNIAPLQNARGLAIGLTVYPGEYEDNFVLYRNRIEGSEVVNKLMIGEGFVPVTNIFSYSFFFREWNVMIFT